ncbi:MAG: nucleotidyltransferase substrate binding protein [Betaproteobacteria bacterium]|jgi:nucleotidyltransferase substrate binding protein (TIGR01987 family)|uniref:Nucleotidyltransferase substrate binding protein n=1 Tax=Candidatus Proximibacter danicus TaxID=2954365 RepID=A0A9D7JZK6_9PROT|nr:nucleotidyltransferase substrate binding protein [Candidatus Proximibacter danicus]MBK9447657.1 nucleotidyltransferase substrate binding protein [Betaproteobacteria bacterium]
MTEKLDLTSLRGAIAALGDGISVVSDSDWFYAQNDAVQRTLIAGVIQNFEMVYEVSVKAIRRQIEHEAASPAETDQDNFRDVLRTAAEKGLIADVEAWFRYRKMRNITAHTYDQEKAQFVYNGTLEFLGDARALLNRLELRNASPAA